MYTSTTLDADGQKLSGGRTYTIEMPADVPVSAFWSVTVYDERGNLLRGSDDGLTVSGTADSGAQRIVVSPDRPATGAWCRAPGAGPYRLLMRLYWPGQAVLDGQWEYPPVRPG